MKRYYVDTSIWIDYHENRKDKSKSLGDPAFQFFMKVIKEKGMVFYSEAIINELRRYYNDDELETILHILSFSRRLHYIDLLPEQYMAAKAISKERNIPFGDALHAIAARDAEAILVTRDHHFDVLKDIVEVKKPEELI